MLRALTYAMRTLARTPGYALTCIAVLALGIGANAAIFSVVYSVILTPLPYPGVSQLVFVWDRFPNMPDPPGGRIQVMRRHYLDWKKQNSVFIDMAAFRASDVTATGTDHPEHISAGFASANLFSMLGASARYGRLFTPDEERAGSDTVVVITDRYFETRFHRDLKTLGQSLVVDGVAYNVIGVLPPRFHLPATWEGSDQLHADVWAPLSRLWKTAADDSNHQLLVAARLKGGVSLEQARTEMAGIAERIALANQKDDAGWTTSVFPFDVEDTSPGLHRALYVLMGAVGFLLLIACANLANLTLARATLRSREVAVRLALGATRSRIIGQLIAEPFLVSIGGAAAGLLIASWFMKLMLALEPPDIQRPELISINLPVFGFAAAIAFLTTLLFGLAPSIGASRADLTAALKAGGGWGSSAPRFRSRQVLIAIEVALALVLVTGAGLMLRSFRALLDQGVGFPVDRLTTVDIDLPASSYSNGPSQSRFFREVLERVRAIPGVTGAALIDNLPLHRISVQDFRIAGQPEPPENSLPLADVGRVSAQYFSVLGLRLKAGRFLTDSDIAFGEAGGDMPVIVNEAFVRKFLPGVNPLTQRLTDGDKKHSFQIAGVVSDYHAFGAENETRPQIFWPRMQAPSASLVVRTASAPESFTKPIQSAIWSVDKDVAANQVLTMQHYMDDWDSQRRFNTLLLSVFAGLALVLAMMGIYGVLSNLVASRLREIGIRMAIGARPIEIAKLIIAQSLIPALTGMAAGLAGSLALGRFLQALLFHVEARDPLTLALAAAAVLVVSPVAIYVPLRRATRVDCTIALRDE